MMCAHNGYAFMCIRNLSESAENNQAVEFNCVKPYECVTVLHAHPSLTVRYDGR